MEQGIGFHHLPHFGPSPLFVPCCTRAITLAGSPSSKTAHVFNPPGIETGRHTALLGGTAWLDRGSCSPGPRATGADVRDVR